MIDMETKIIPKTMSPPSKSSSQRHAPSKQSNDPEDFLRDWIDKLEGTVTVSKNICLIN
jgi:hypothetical protein